MNAKRNWKRINDILRERGIDNSQFRHICCLRFHPDPTKETDEHVRAKLEECLKLRRLGHPFLSEVQTIKRDKRYDILDLEDNADIECETGKSKKKKYEADKEVRI